MTLTEQMVIDSTNFIVADGNEVPYKLQVGDRSDCCGVAALYEVWLDKDSVNPLLFCGHHYRKNQRVLETQAYVIRNEYSRLTQNRLVGDANS